MSNLLEFIIIAFHDFFSNRFSKLIFSKNYTECTAGQKALVLVISFGSALLTCFALIWGIYILLNYFRG